MTVLAVFLAGLIVILVLAFLQAPGFFLLLLLLLGYGCYRGYDAVRRTWKEFNEGVAPDEDKDTL